MPEVSNEVPINLMPHSMLHDVLTSPDFTKHVEVTFSANEAQKRTQVNNPNFNFDGLDEEGVLRMASLSSTLENLSAKATKLKESGRKKDALVLARNISVLSNPIDDTLKATHGNLDMAAAFLGLKRVERANDWLEFMVRNQGKKPSDFV